MSVTPSIVRLVVAACAGLVIGGVLAVFAPWQIALTGGWIATGAILLVWVWLVVLRFDGDATRGHATMEDPARSETGVVLLTAAVVSLLGVGFTLAKANNASGIAKAGLTVAAIATVAVSWGVVHTVFALRYAHLFYSDPVGGIDFKTGKSYDPDYRDFAYVAFTVGMTFQVSDTDIQSREIRHSVLSHALVAFLFGAVILAVTVNLVASLLA